MKVKELIVQLLEEDRDNDVVLFVDDDVAIIDGIEPVTESSRRGFCSLSTDIKLIRK